MKPTIHTALIQTGTGNLPASIDFYKKLHFTLLSAKNPTLFSDGRFVLEIAEQPTLRSGLKLYGNNWKTFFESLEPGIAIMEIEGGYLISDPNGVKVYLMEGPPAYSFDLAGLPQALPGKFAGLSIEAVDFEGTVDFWRILGYQETMGSVEQGWIAMENGSGIGISVMKAMTCPHLFFNPGLTFFNAGNNLSVIQKIRKVGIPIAEEIRVLNDSNLVDNIIVCDPGGLGFFIFND